MVSLPPDNAPPVLFTVPPTLDSLYAPKLLSINAADSFPFFLPCLRFPLSPGCSNSIWATRLPRLPATRNTLRRRWGTPKYLASKIRHAISHSSERTIHISKPFIHPFTRINTRRASELPRPAYRGCPVPPTSASVSAPPGGGAIWLLLTVASCPATSITLLLVPM